MAVIGFFGRHYLNNFWRHANVLQCWDMRWYTARMFNVHLEFVWFPERSQGSSLLSCYCWYCLLYYIGFVIWTKGQKINLEFEANTHNPRAWNNIMGTFEFFFQNTNQQCLINEEFAMTKKIMQLILIYQYIWKIIQFKYFYFFVNCLFYFLT